MLKIEPDKLNTPELQRWLQSGIGPRPIALVSTISNDDIPNLSPFSFYNVFSSKPPIIGFSPARRGRNNTLKDTYNNLIDNGECVVHSVTYNIVEQVNLASGEYAPNIDEFEIAGFTKVKSNIVKPFRVKESPFAMECKLNQMISFADTPGAGNLAICEVLLIHIDESIIVDGAIHPELIDLVGRNGGEYYTRSYANSLFEVPKPTITNPISYINLPDKLKYSKVLSANNIALLASQPELSNDESLNEFLNYYNDGIPDINAFYRYYQLDDYHQMLRYALALYKVDSFNFYYLELTLKTVLDFRDIAFAKELAYYISKL